MARTLQSSVAGTWYPADPGRLAATVDGLLEAAGPPPTAGTRVPSSVIAPHAGLTYSGRVAACAFRPWAGRPHGVVVLIGPSHHFAFDGLVVPESAALATPLGIVPVDVASVDRIAGHPRVARTDTPFEPEHCLEIELPFLQRALRPGWTVVPVLTGSDVRGRIASELAALLRDGLPDDAVWVASSDFTHFGSRFGYRPFTDRIPDRIEELDRSVLEPIERVDPDALERRLDETGATVCGRHAIGLLLRAASAGRTGRTVAYDTSGAQTGDWSHTVSYAAVRFTDDA